MYDIVLTRKKGESVHRLDFTILSGNIKEMHKLFKLTSQSVTALVYRLINVCPT